MDAKLVTAEDAEDLEIVLVVLGYGRTDMGSAAVFSAASSASVSRKSNLLPILTSSKVWPLLQDHAACAAESPGKRDFKLALSALSSLLPSSAPLSEGEVAEKHRLAGRLWDHEYLKDTDMAKVKTKMLDLGTAVGCFLVDTAMAA